MAAAAYRTFPYAPALLFFLSELSELILVSPRIRLLEASICRSHYLAHGNPSGIINPDDGSIDESLCKLPEIQTRLAYIRGWQVFCESIPVMALAMPWGALADRVGRKRVLGINFLGCLLHVASFLAICHPRSEVAVEWVWATGLAFVLGGGPRTASVLIMALVNDTSPGAERSERFYYTYSACLVTELVAMPTASLLMSQSILLPFAVALAALGVCFPVLASVKGVARSRLLGRIGEGEDRSNAATGLLDETASEQRPAPSKRNLASGLHALYRDLSSPPARNILLVLLGHFICPVRQELVFQIMIPYASSRFSLPIASAGLLLSVVASTNLFIFLFLLPPLTRALTRRHLPADVLTASCSSLVVALGSLAIGAATTFPVLLAATMVFSAGFGIRLGLLSVLTALVDPAKVGRMYTLVTVVEGAGEMVSAPALQGLWAWGLQRGVGWEAAPWVAGAVVYAAGWWWIGRVRVPREG